MATFDVRFLGCKVSHLDAQDVRARLLADGHEERSEGADVAVVNTCCVTNEALSKSRQAAARAARSHRRVYVTGCGANLGGDAFAGLPDNVVVLARRSEATPDAVADDLGALGCVRDDVRLERVRAFVKIQDGCSFSCNFCVIPLVRGGTRSRAAHAVLTEIRRRVAQGHREVVLTGVNLGCFRDRAAGYDLPRLVREAGAVPGLARLRLSSIEINHVSDGLIAALRETHGAAHEGPCVSVLAASGDEDRRRRPGPVRSEEATQRTPAGAVARRLPRPLARQGRVRRRRARRPSRPRLRRRLLALARRRRARRARPRPRCRRDGGGHPCSLTASSASSSSKATTSTAQTTSSRSATSTRGQTRTCW